VTRPIAGNRSKPIVVVSIPRRLQIPPKSQLARILKARAANRTNPPKPQPPQPAPEAPAPDPKILHIPERLRDREPLVAKSFIDDDPVFKTGDTARILGVEPSRLEKWRQRDQGPDYLQYEKSGSVRYEFSALVAFKAAHRVRPSRRPHPGRRR